MMTTVDLMDPELVRDPFGVYSRIREQAPMARGVIPGLEPLWIATRYEDVKTVMSDARFVNDATNAGAPDMTEQLLLASGIPAKYVRPTMSDFDGPRHTRLRRLVSRAFTARRIADLRPRVEEITEDLLDRLPQDEVVDLLQHFAYPLPITVICELVGVPEQDRMRWRDWSRLLAPGMGPGMGEAVRGMAGHTRELIEQRRASPAGDLISGLASDDQLSETELIRVILSLVVAGYETTAHLIANGTAALLTHPHQLALLRADPSLLPRAVNELIRYCGPALGTRMRYATEDTEISGTLVHKGEAVMPILAAANYDPRVFDAPEQLDVTRDGEPHVGFGHGPHYCLGAALARQEGEVAFGALLRRFPNLALAGDLQRGPNPGTWHLAGLPVNLR